MNEASFANIDTNMIGQASMGQEASIVFMTIYYLIIVLFIFGMGIGLYLINKKLGEKHAWLSFIPVLQYWSLAQAGGKSFIKYIVFPFIAYIFAIIGMMISIFSMNSIIMGIAGILLFISYIYLIITYIKVLHGISKRTNRGAWTTIGFLFIPFIMFPVVGFKLEINTQQTAPSIDGVKL